MKNNIINFVKLLKYLAYLALFGLIGCSSQAPNFNYLLYGDGYNSSLKFVGGIDKIELVNYLFHMQL